MSGPESPGPQLRFGTIAAAGDQLAVFLVGDVDARVDGAGGLTLSGAHAAVGTDRLLPRPTSPVVLSLNGGEVRDDPADVHDLRAGIVPGAGVVLWTAGFELDDRENAEDDAGGRTRVVRHRRGDVRPFWESVAGPGRARPAGGRDARPERVGSDGRAGTDQRGR